MTLGYPRIDVVWGLKGQRSRLELGLGTAIRHGFELHEGVNKFGKVSAKVAMVSDITRTCKLFTLIRRGEVNILLK